MDGNVMEEKVKIPRKYSTKKRDRLRAVKLFSAMIIVFFLVFRFVIGLSWVSGVSMRPTMVNGDMVLYFRLEKDYRTDDVISIKMPSGDYYIKRIVALPGDTVDIIDGVLYVNGAAENSLYAKGSTNPEADTIQYPLTLGRNQYFALGDNRADSVDSRTYGPVSESQIRGKIIFHLQMPWSEK